MTDQRSDQPSAPGFADIAQLITAARQRAVPAELQTSLPSIEQIESEFGDLAE